MTTPAAVLAVVRAGDQAFRGPEDAVLYAIHAAVLTSGYGLIGVGDDAKLEGVPSDAPEVSESGWNALPDRYTLLYRSDDPTPATPAAPAAGAAGASGPSPAPPDKRWPPRLLLLKALVVGSSLLVTLAGGGDGGSEPEVLEVDPSHYYDPTSADAAAAAAATPPARRYKDTRGLCSRIGGALAALAAPGGGGGGAGGAGGAEAGAGKGAARPQGGAGGEDRQGRAEGRGEGRRPSRPREVDDDYDPLRIGPPMRGGARPLRAGEDDIMPLSPLGGPLGGPLGPIGGGMGGGPMMPPGGIGPIGGMHVGPGHPFFSDRMRHPDVGPGGPGGPLGGGRQPGGARWDPISPEGLEGWRPDDFQQGLPGQGGSRGRGLPLGRGGPPAHPDIEQPGPGRNDWDSMYG